MIASNFVLTLVGLLLLSFATTFVLSDLELKCEPISEHIFRARTSSILTSSVLHAKARPYEATMSSALLTLGVHKNLVEVMNVCLAKCALYSVQCDVRSVKFAVYSLQCTVWAISY